MKFLVLALCVYAASAGVPSYRGTQPWQQAKATAQAVVPVAQAVTNSVVQALVQPAVVAKTILTENRDVYAPILRSESEVNDKGFNYIYETGNGITAKSSGTLKKVDNADVVVVQGEYSYTSPDGTPVVLSYTADENGYQPRSDLLPVGPAIPEAILRSLQYIAEHPQQSETIRKF